MSRLKKIFKRISSRKKFLLIILLFALFAINNYWLNAGDLFMKVGPIFLDQYTLFNERVGIDFKLAKKAHLNFEFGFAPILGRSEIYIIDFIIFITFNPLDDLKSKTKPYYGGGLGIAFFGGGEELWPAIPLVFLLGNEIKFPKFNIIFPEFRLFLPLPFWDSYGISLMGGIKW